MLTSFGCSKITNSNLLDPLYKFNINIKILSDAIFSQLGGKIQLIVMVSLYSLVEENLESELSLSELKLCELDQKLQKVNWLIKELETLIEVESKTSEQLAEQLLEYVELHESLANALELALLMPHKPTLMAIKGKLKLWESRLDESNKLLSTLMRATVDPTCW